MPNFNRTIIAGHLVRDAEVRDAGDSMVARGSIASTCRYKGKEKTLFLDFEIWGKGAEAFAQYTQKGSSVLLSGTLEQSRWEDNKGNKRSRIFLRVDEFNFLKSAKQSNEDENENIPF